MENNVIQGQGTIDEIFDQIERYSLNNYGNYALVGIGENQKYFLLMYIEINGSIENPRPLIRYTTLQIVGEEQLNGKKQELLQLKSKSPEEMLEGMIYLLSKNKDILYRIEPTNIFNLKKAMPQELSFYALNKEIKLRRINTYEYGDIETLRETIKEKQKEAKIDYSKIGSFDELFR